MSDPGLKALAIDVAALEAVVRALARNRVRRSRGEFLDFMDSLQLEAERLAAFSPVDDLHNLAARMLDGWIEELKSEGLNV